MKLAKLLSLIVLALCVGIAVAASVVTPLAKSLAKLSQGAVADATPQPKWPVHINQPHGPPTVATGQVDRQGQPISVACSTCHGEQGQLADKSTDQLQDFHQGLTVEHGSLTCMSCHNRDDYDALRLADGQTVTYPQVMTLCAQCHGPQHRDFQHGSHGGMTGYWDLQRGPRQRNNCIDCHDAHAPVYPQMMPVFAPHDVPTRIEEAAHE